MAPELPDDVEGLVEEAEGVAEDFQDSVNEAFNDVTETGTQQSVNEAFGATDSPETEQIAVEEVVDVYLLLGEGDNVQRWVPVEMEIERSMYDDVDSVRFVGLPVERDAEPIFGDGEEGLKARVFGDSIPAHYLPDGKKPTQINKLTKLYEGEAAHFFEKGDGTYFIRCTNIMSTILNEEVNILYEEPTKVKKILEDAIGQAGIPSDQYVINVPSQPDLPSVFSAIENGVSAAISNISSGPKFLTAKHTSKKLKKVLNDLTTRVDLVWWVTRNNRLYIGPPAGNALGPGEDSSVQLSEYIIDSDAGKQTPPYRSVRVIGDGVVSKNGWESVETVNANQFFKQYGMAAPLEGGDIVKVDEDAGLAGETFVFRSHQIKTQKQADDAAQSIMDELLNQIKGGTVTMVGRSYVKPHDKLQLPERFGGEEYIINRVTHFFNSSDGYITTVECGGLGEKDTAYYTGETSTDGVPGAEKKPEGKLVNVPDDVKTQTQEPTVVSEGGNFSDPRRNFSEDGPTEPEDPSFAEEFSEDFSEAESEGERLDVISSSIEEFYFSDTVQEPLEEDT